MNIHLVSEFFEEVTLMYIRLAFWTLSLAYTAALFARTVPGSSSGTMLTAAFFGAVIGFSLGGMLINRRTRKRRLSADFPLHIPLHRSVPNTGISPENRSSVPNLKYCFQTGR